MRIVLLQEIQELQWELEGIIYQLLEEKGYYWHLHNHGITIVQIIEFWVMDRLDKICHIPVTSGARYTVPDYVAIELLNRCRHLESRLWSLVRAPATAEWTHANVEMRRYTLKIEMFGS